MESFKERLLLEQDELCHRIEKLQLFMAAPKFAELDYAHRSLLEIQLKAMDTYYKVLTVRISLLV